MRLSKQLCFLVAAAIASAVDGAPIGEKLQRRQAITLELTPTQQVDVDGSREVPTILIADNGYQVGQPNCLGGDCQSYSINMPPIRQMEDFTAPQTSYDPYAENYSPYRTYPPSRANLYAPPPVQSQVVNAGGPPHVSALPPPPSNLPPKWTNAGWNAPLIPSGSFSESLQGTPTVPASVTPTSTTTAPLPIPGTMSQVQNSPSANMATGQPLAPAAPLPLTAPLTGQSAAMPTTLPAPVAPGAEVKDEKKATDIKPTESTLPPPAAGTPSVPDVKKIADEAAAASNREQSETKIVTPPAPAPAPAPAPQRRGLRAGTSKQSSPSSIKKRSPAPKRLRKRQLESELTSEECDPTNVEQVEVLVPVTEEELTALQEGSAEIVSYPSIGMDGTEQKLYDVLPLTSEPTLSVPTLKNIYEEGSQKMSATESQLEPGQETQATKERVLDSEEPLRPRSLNAGSQEAPKFNVLEKRLKYGSNGLNASMVGNGAGRTKYGFTIHDNKNGASSISPLGVCTTMALAAVFGVYAALL